MWTKNFRICLFNAVYQELFSENLPDFSSSLDWDPIFELVTSSSAELPNQADLNRSLEDLKQNRSQFETTLRKYLQSWHKTYRIVRAILLCFLQEVTEAKRANATSTDFRQIMSKYTRLTQDYVGGDNTDLVYAIINHILQDELGITPDTSQKTNLSQQAGDLQPRSENVQPGPVLST